MLKNRVFEEQGTEGSELPGAPELPTEESVDKWSDFLQEEDFGDEPEPEVTPEPETSEPESPPPEIPPPEPAPAVPEVPPAPEQPPAPALTPEQIAEMEKKFDEQLIAHFAINDDDTLALQTEPEKVLPRMAAKLYKDTIATVMQQIHSQIPAMLQNYAQASTREMQAQQEFFTAWPELKEHSQQVLQMGVMYRQVNPKASPQEAVQRIGEMTMAALGLKRAAVSEPPALSQPPSFRPAGAGRVATPAPELNKWEKVMDDDDDD